MNLIRETGLEYLEIDRRMSVAVRGGTLGTMGAWPGAIFGLKIALP